MPQVSPATATSSLSYVDLFLGTLFNPIDTVKAIATGTTPDWQLTMIQNQTALNIQQAGGSASDVAAAAANVSQAFSEGNIAASQNWSDWWKQNARIVEWILAGIIILYALGLGLRFKEDFFK